MKIRKGLSILLSICMMASMIPGVAFATETGAEDLGGYNYVSEETESAGEEGVSETPESSIQVEEPADTDIEIETEIPGDSETEVMTETWMEVETEAETETPVEIETGEEKQNLPEPESQTGDEAKAKTEADVKAADDLRATRPTQMWVEPTESNGIPARIDVFKKSSGGTTNSPTYTCLLCLPGDVNLANVFLSWDGEMTCTVNGQTYSSGALPAPAVGTQTNYAFKSGRNTTTFKITTYQGSPSVQRVFIEIDESDGKPTVAQMKASSDHSVECSGIVYINGTQYELSKMKGRGNASWKESLDKKPYNLTLGSKINFPGVDSDKTKKWSFLAEVLDRSLLCNRAGFKIAELLGIGQDTTSADVWMNGEYQGCYMVTPKTDSFVTKDGYMIEEDNYKEPAVSAGGDPQFTLEGLKEASGWSSCYNRITVKKMGDNLLLVNGVVDESPENMTAAAGRIQTWLQDAWDAIRSNTGYNSKGKYYTDYIDIESFAKMYLMHEYVKSYDVCAGSILFHRDGQGDNDKLFAGPVWDLDNAMGSVYQNGSLGKADDRSNGDRRSGQGDFIINVTEYKTSIYKTLYTKHEDFRTEVTRQYNKNKSAFNSAEDACAGMIAEIQASALMNHAKVEDLGNGTGKNNHYYGSDTRLGDGQYQQTYVKTTDWGNYAANLKTYIRTRTLWFANKYYDSTYVDPATCEHQYTETVVPATCTATGLITYYCPICKDTYTETIPKTAHDYHDGVCSVCGEALITVAIDCPTGASVTVYKTGEFETIDKENADSAHPRDSDSGRIDCSGNGQINFVVNLADGYELAGVTAAPNNYKNLKGPADTGVENGYRLTKVSGPFTISIQVTAIPYEITYDLAGGELPGGTTNPQTYTVTQSITLSNPVRQGYTFAGWTGTGLEEETAEVTIPVGSTGDRSYTANWVKNAFTVDDITGEYTYTGAAQEPALTVKDGSRTLVKGTDYTVSYSNNTNAGTASVTVTGIGDYQSADEVSKEFVIGKAPLTVTAKAKTITYGDAPAGNGVSYAGFVNNETEAVLSGELEYTYNYEQYDDAGSYKITPAGLTADNYAISYADGTLTVEAKEVGLSWGSTTFTYDGESHVPEATATGVIEGDTVTVTVSGAQTNAGTYTATAATLDNSNYKLPSANTTSFTISTAAMDVSAAGYSGTYDGASHGITVTVGSPAGAAVTYSTSENGTYTASAPAYKDAGEYTVYYKVTKDNYTQVTGSAKVTITAKEVGLTWTDTTFTYDGKSHVPTATATGLVGGETVTVTVSSAQTNAGTYTATATALNNNNYKLPSAKTKEFTIAQKEVGLTWGTAVFTYDGKSHVPTATATGLVEGDNVTVTVSGAQTNAGTYTAMATALSSSNYKLPGEVTKQFTINPAAMNVAAAGYSGIYDGASHSIDVTVVSPAGAAVTYSTSEDGTYTASAPTYKNAGEYTIFYKVTLANYIQISGSAKVTIAAKEVGLTWSDLTLTYDGKSHVPTATATGIVEGDTVNVTVSGAQTNAGTYTATATALSSSNYKLPTAVTKQFTINPAEMNVTATGYNGTYDGAVHGITVTVGSPSGVAVTYSSSENGTYTTSALTYKNVGEYTVYYKVTKDNYTQVTGSAKVTITAKEVGLTWSDLTFTYDGKSHVPTATATGLVEGDTVTVTVSGAQTNAGTYTATATALSNSNYKLPTAVTKQFTINPAAMDVSAAGYSGTYDGTSHGITVTVSTPTGAAVTYSTSEDGTYTASAPTYKDAGEYTVYYKVTKDNYTQVTGSAKVTITAKEVGLTWGTSVFTYDGKSHVPTATATGLVEGDTVTVTVSGAQTNAGTYTATATALSSSNYKLPAEVTKQFTINPASMDVTAAGYSGTYDGASHGITVTVASPAGAAVTYSTSEDGTYTASAPTYKNAGEYTVYYKVTLANYTQVTGSEKVTITAKEVGLTWSDLTFTYDGKSHVPTATATGLVSGDTVTVTVSGAKTSAGSYTATATALSNSNYKLPETKTKDFTIAQKEVGLTWTDTTFTYDGKSHVPTVTATGIVEGDTVNVTVSGAQTNAGTYTATATALSNSNYKLPSAVTKQFTINTAAMDVTTTGYSGIYDGASHGITVTVASPAGAAVTYSSSEDGTYTASAPVYKNAGEYTVYYKVTLANYTQVTGSAKVTITAKEVGLTWSEDTFTYDGKSHVPTATATGLVEGDSVMVTVSGAQTNAGTYTARATALSSSNYKLPDAKTKEFTIAQKEVGLTWGTAVFTYDGKSHVPTATATGLVEGDTVTVTVSGAQTNAGTYTARATALSSSNYKLPAAVTKQFTINPAAMDVAAAGYSGIYDGVSHGIDVTVVSPAGAAVTYSTSEDGTYTTSAPTYKNAGEYTVYYKVTLANYTQVTGSAKVTITAKEVGLTWTDLTFTYDGKSHVPTATATGLVEGDNVTVTVSGAQTNAGTYTARATALSSNNYKLPTAVTKQFTINPAAMDVTAAGYNGIYDGKSHGITITVTNPAGATVTYSTSEDGTYTASAPTYKNVGEYTVYYKVTLANYTQVTGSAKVTITAKEVGLTWSDLSFTYDGKSHVPTATATGLVEGDTVTVTVSGAQTNAGTYTATATALSSSNYKLSTAVTKQFTINPAAMDVTASGYNGTYDGKSHGITVTVASPSGAAVTYSSSADGTYTASAPAYKDAGEYTVYYKVTLANYTQVTGSAKVTITAKEVGLTWTDTTFTYDGKSHAPAATATGLVSGDTVTVTVSGAQTNAGSYTATAAALSSSNYKLPDAKTKDFTIEQKEVGLTWGTAVFTYDGKSHVPTATATGLVEGDTVTVTVSGAQTNAGTYTARATALSSSNYKLPAAVTKQFTINPAAMDVTAAGYSGIYDGAAHGITVTVVSPAGAAVTYSTSEDGTYTASAPTYKNAGEYTVYYKVTLANYTQVTGSAKITITAKEVGLTWSDLTFTYDGKTHVPTATATGLVEGDTVSVTVSGAQTNAGTYTATATALSSNNYKLPTAVTKQFTINPAAMDVTASDYSGTYDGKSHGITVSVTSPAGAAVTYSTSADGTYTASAPVYKNAGEYTVYYKVTLANYTQVTGSAKVTITAKEVGLTWSDLTFTYDGKSHVPTATATGLVEGDTVNVTVSGAQTNAGTYTATVTALSNSNYKLPTAVTKQFTINTAAMDVTATGYNGIYDGKSHGITVTVTSPAGAAVTYSTSENGTYTASAPTYKNADEYTVYYKVTLANYTQVTGSAKVTIMAKEVGLTWTDTTFTYDGKSHVPTAIATGLVEGDTVTVTVRGAQTNAGTYTATATALSSSNYKLPAVVTTQFTIQLAEMNVTAAGYNGIYDGENHGISVTVAAPADVLVTYSESADGNYTEEAPLYKNVGEYTVYYKAAKENYIQASGSAKVIITPKEVGLTWSDLTFTYDGRSHVPTATATGIVEGDTVTVTVSGAQTNAGTYTATATALSDSNYKLPAGVMKQFTIQPAEMDVLAEDYTGSYDGQAHSITVTVISPEGASVTYSKSAGGTYSEAAPTFTNAGEYTVFYRVTKENYIQVSGSAKVTITKADQTMPEIDFTDETISGKKDGTITGLTAAMEISTDGKTYTPVTAETIGNLAPGTYYVRLAETDNYEASDAVEIVIAASDVQLVVTFNSNGGSTVEPAYVDYGQKAASPAAPEKQGYWFAGWYSDEGLTDPYDFNTAVTDNITVYAKWNADSDTAYTVEHYLEGLDGIFTIDSGRTQSMAGTTATKATASPLNVEGFSFDEKNTGNVISGTIAADGSLVLKLYYTRNSYQVSYRYSTDAPADATALPADMSVKYGAEVKVAADASAAGYTFSGWSTADAVVAGGKFTMPARAVIFSGSWTVNYYTITFVDEDGETVLDSQSVAYGETPVYAGDPPTKAADADYKYSFAAWEPEIVPVTGDAVYRAVFDSEARQYGQPSWNWTPDDQGGFSSAAAVFTTNDGEAVFSKTETTADIKSTTTAAACEKDGSTVYTATVTFGGKQYSDSKTVVIPATGHKYGQAEYAWAADNSKVTATAVCEHDASHVVTETVQTSYEVIREPAIGETGTGLYTAEFENKLFSRQTKEVELPAVTYKLSETSLIMPTESTKTLTVTDNYGRTVQAEWSSSDERIATVDGGVVNALRYGKAVITAEADGYSESCEVSTLFYDVTKASDYYYPPVYWAADEGVTKGYDGVYFGVGRDCARREVMIFLWRISGCPTEDAEGNAYGDARTMFNDMQKYGPDSDTNKAIAWGCAEGIAKGYADGGFHPTASIVRKDVMIMLYRLAGKPDVSGTLTWPDCKSYKPASDTYKAILWGSQNKITNGYNSGPYAGQFGAMVNCLREQIVTFMYRYHNL